MLKILFYGALYFILCCAIGKYLKYNRLRQGFYDDYELYQMRMKGGDDDK